MDYTTYANQQFNSQREEAATQARLAQETKAYRTNRVLDVIEAAASALEPLGIQLETRQPSVSCPGTGMKIFGKCEFDSITCEAQVTRNGEILEDKIVFSSDDVRYLDTDKAIQRIIKAAIEEHLKQ